MDSLNSILLTSNQRKAQQCKVCGGSGFIEQHTSANAPKSKMKCLSCGGDGIQKNCFATPKQPLKE